MQSCESCNHCDSCEKRKARGSEEKKLLTARINRIVGQLNGVKRMIDEDRYCDDVLTQLAAVGKATRSLAALVFEEHMHTCLVEHVQRGELEIVDEVVELFKKFQ